jgi:hypothetical protein
MGSWPCRLPLRMLRSFLAVMVGPLRLWSARRALTRSLLVRAVLAGAPCFALSGAACGLDLQGELIDRGDGGTSSGLSTSGSSGSIGSSGSNSGGGGGMSSGSSSGASSSGSGDDSGILRSADGSTPPSSSGGDDSGDADLGPGPDGAVTRCDFSGTWATQISIDVNWVPQGLTGVILAPGSGKIQQWIRSTRVISGTSTTDTAVVCGITLPDFSGTSFVGGETYGVRFPTSLFDNGYLPPFAIFGTQADTSPTTAFTTKPSAALIGLTLADPATATWPATITTAVDTDKDMNPGVTVNAATGAIPGRETGTYSEFPVDVLADRANQLFIVIRQVTQLTGAATDCNHMSGTTTIPKIPDSSSGKYAIDSHVIGCNLAAGGTCSSSQTSFIDDTQPVFSPSGSASFASVRVKPSATCADVRAMVSIP